MTREEAINIAVVSVAEALDECPTIFIEHEDSFMFDLRAAIEILLGRHDKAAKK